MKLQELISPDRIAGVEVILTGGGMDIYLSILKKEKSSIITELSKEGITSIGQLKSSLPEKTAVYLTVNGKGILHKKTSPDQHTNDNAVLQSILPNANTSDFYFQIYKTVSDGGFFSVIRKNVLDELLHQFKRQDITVIECFLGPFAISSIISLLNREELSIGNHNLRFYENSITDLSEAPAKVDYRPLDTPKTIEMITVGGENMKTCLMLSFATAFSYFFPVSQLSGNIQSIQTGKEEFKQKNLFEFSKWAFAIFFFVIFIANFFVFNQIFDKKNALTAQLSAHQENLDRYESFKKELDDKRALIEKLGISKNSRISYYADQLALDMPSSILLSKLNVHPAIKKNNPGEESFFEFHPDILLIEGSCAKSIEYNDWIKTIQQKKWVREVIMSNYGQNKETGRGDFVLEVKAR